MSARDDFLSAGKLARSTVEVAGQTYHIQELNGKGRAELAQQMFDARVPDPGNPGGHIQRMPQYWREAYIVRGLITADGQRVFPDAAPEDEAAVADAHGERVILPLYEAIMALSQIDESIEETAGN